MKPNVETLVLGELETNCYIVSLDGRGDAVVIDPAAEEEKIIKSLRGRTPTVVLTHGHFDHTGALNAFAGRDIYCNRLDRPMLNDPSMNVGGRFGDNAYRPDATHDLEEGETYLLAGMPFTVMHTPGHTIGCVCLICGDVMFTGDTLFHRAYGRVDHPTGDFAALRASLRRLFHLEKDYVLYPGHGESTTLFAEVHR